MTTADREQIYYNVCRCTNVLGGCITTATRTLHGFLLYK